MSLSPHLYGAMSELSAIVNDLEGVREMLYLAGYREAAEHVDNACLSLTYATFNTFDTIPEEVSA